MSIIILTSRLLAFVFLFQSIEYIKLKNTFLQNGIWRWHELKKDFLFLPKYFFSVFDFLLRDNIFHFLLVTRIIVSILTFIFPHWIFLIYLFLSTFLIALRWRGAFNGGSDYLSLSLSLSLFLALFKPESPLVTKAIIWYMTIQVLSSYFLAGLYKIKEEGWRNGTALCSFITSPLYTSPVFISRLVKNKTWSFLLSWGVILYELLFPFILLNKNIAFLFLVSGVFFHFINFMIFGLNRFFLIWTITYPLLYFTVINLI